MGVVDADRVILHGRPSPEHTRATPFTLSAIGEPLPRVDIAYAYGGADDVAVRAFIAAGARGIVSAGFAPGMGTPSERRCLEAASRDGVVVVQASRVGSGRVARRKSVAEAGWIGAGDLNPQKARILLTLCLALDLSTEDIQSAFDRF